MKQFLINGMYEMRECKASFFASSQKLKELLHSLHSGKDLQTLRETLLAHLDTTLSQMNFELLYVETKRELEKAQLVSSQLRHEVE